jgi:hypothetical protein
MPVPAGSAVVSSVIAPRSPTSKMENVAFRRALVTAADDDLILVEQVLTAPRERPFRAVREQRVFEGQPLSSSASPAPTPGSGGARRARASPDPRLGDRLRRW